MASNNADQALTMIDLAKTLDPDGSPAMVINQLTQSTAILDDILWLPSNDKMSHRTTVVTGLPTTYTRRVNRGTPGSKSTKSQFVDTLTVLETRCETDVMLLDLYGSANQMRVSENKLNIESLLQKATDLLFHGNIADDPEEFNGLLPRYNTLSGNVADNVISCGGTGSDLSSIWLVGWGEGKVTGRYPKHLPAGIDHHDLPVQLVQQSTDIGGRSLECYVDIFRWALGLTVEDWRYVVRIANIEPDDVVGVTLTQELADYPTNILYAMDRAIERFPVIEACKPVWYMSRAIKEGLSVQMRARTTANVFKTEDVQGKKVSTYCGFPIRIIDKLTNTEEAVS